MESREFVRLLKHEAIDEMVKVVLKKLKAPRSPQPIPEAEDAIQRGISEFYNAGARTEQQQAAWFDQLSEKQQEMLAEIILDCAELSASSICTLIDGVGGDYEGTFELYAIDSKGRRRLINPQNTDMLHDLLSEVCAEDRER